MNDEEWLRALSGKPVGEHTPEALAVETLRSAVIGYAGQEDQTAIPAGGLDRLLKRMESEGLLQSDDAWLEALSGKSGAGGASASIEQTALMREVIIAHAAESHDAASAEGLDSLLATLRKQGLLEGGGAAGGLLSRVKAFWSWLTSPRFTPVGAAAALVLAVVLFAKVREDSPGPPIKDYRGPDHVIPFLVVEDVDAATAKLSALLRAEGIEPTVRELGLNRQVEGKVPEDKRQVLNNKLRAYGAQVPEDGDLVLEIRLKPLE
ncbi:MAG: hypothetical protein ACKVQA_11800 [Burkholderiales bacterium]